VAGRAPTGRRGRVGRTTEQHRYGFLVAAAAVLGGVGFGAAWVLLRLIGLFTHVAFYHRVDAGYAEVHLAPFAHGVYLVAILAAANAAAGLAIRYGHPALSGHGIPEVMESVLTRDGRIPPRVALLKPIFAAVVIGLGGPFGAEGPIIQTGGAIGSLLGQILPASAAERKVLIACGAAAGMTGIFGTPLAAVLLPVELITFEFSLRTLALPAISAAVALALRGALMDARPLFLMPATQAVGPLGLAWCVPFGVLAGLEAAGITRVLYWLEDLYHHVRWAGEVVRPAIGALVVGLIALAGPEVLGVGYDLIREVLAGQASTAELLRIVGFKGLGWLAALASGTVGGVLAPLFMIAGSTGALLGRLLQGLTGLAPGLVGLIFMGAVFGGCARVVLTGAVFAAEVTGDFGAMAPLLVATAMATMVAERLLPYNVMTGKLVRRGLRVSLDYYAHHHDTPTVPAEAAVAAEPAAPGRRAEASGRRGGRRANA
jgi:CIC family chloride channel protein